jgi:hypothetical protein
MVRKRAATDAKMSRKPLGIHNSPRSFIVHLEKERSE